MESPHAFPPAVRSFAVGVFSLATLVIVVMLLALVFPYRGIANQSSQADLLYDLLGHLDNHENGHFTMIDDPVMGAELVKLIKKNALDSTSRTAYLLDQHNHQIVWSAAAFDLDKLPADYAYPLVFDLPNLAKDDYTMQFITSRPARSVDPQAANKLYQLAVQNFWTMGEHGVPNEYQMVVALPVE